MSKSPGPKKQVTDKENISQNYPSQPQQFRQPQKQPAQQGQRISSNQFYSTNELENLMNKEATSQRRYANQQFQPQQQHSQIPRKQIQVPAPNNLVQSEYPQINTQSQITNSQLNQALRVNSNNYQ